MEHMSVDLGSGDLEANARAQGNGRERQLLDETMLKLRVTVPGSPPKILARLNSCSMNGAQ
jgi:hypothetical protein